MIPRLLFDLTATQPANGAKRHGGGIYGEIVFRRILERNLEVEAFYDSRKWLNPEIRQLIDDYGIITYDNAEMPLQEIVAKSNCDRVYTCGENQEFRELVFPMKFYTLHGMRELESPLDNYFFRYSNKLKTKIKFKLKQLLKKQYRDKHIKRVKRMIDSGTRFIVVSNHTASSIKAFMPEYAHLDIPVFYSPSTSSVTECSNNGNTAPYFLLVSADRWVKNGLRAIMALDRMFDTTTLAGFKAIITGATSKSCFRYKFKHPERFEFRGYVDDSELQQLYSNAYALIYPSLNEGFGYPPLEAMANGVPVIASPLTSIPEICADAAIYFNPFSVDEIAARILMIADPETHDLYASRGILRHEEVKQRQDADLERLIDYLYA